MGLLANDLVNILVKNLSICTRCGTQGTIVHYDEIHEEDRIEFALTPYASYRYCSNCDDFTFVLNDVDDEEENSTASKKIGRNERCHCGSGKKFKHCCGRT